MRKLIYLAVLLHANYAFAQSVDETDLKMAYGDAAVISVATGNKQSLRRAPAVASVFTAADIRATGARDLRDLLNLVPGFHVSVSPFIYEPRYQVRGVHSTYSPQVLVMIDGVRRQSIYLGSAETVWVDMPLDNIERVEVIRGPGSALYGADAFSAVISITTKSAVDMQGTQIGVHAGSFGEVGTQLQFGQKLGDWDLGGYFRVAQNDGPNSFVEADAQTGLDRLFKTNISRAPGFMKMEQHAVDAAFELRNGNWQLKSKHKRRILDGTMNGLANALSPNDRIHQSLHSLDLSYVEPESPDHWAIQAQAGIEASHFKGYYELFPPGAFGGAYPLGMIGAPEARPRTLYVQSSATATFGSHRVRLGAGWNQIGITSTDERKNFTFVVVPGVGPVPVPLGAIVNAREADELFLAPRQRTLQYLLAQDEWVFAQDWTMTVGLRHDRYSDFGSTTNPRLALVWDARHDLTVKLLHGKAFRAPAFVELYLRANPVALGNPNLKPERMHTTELVFDWQASPTLNATLNLFDYRMTEILRAVPNLDPYTGNTFANQGEQLGHGFETEWTWRPRADFNVVASYSFQKSIDARSRLPVADTPQRMFKLRMDWELTSDLASHIQLRQISDRLRASGDQRAAVADLNTVDLGLVWNSRHSRGWSATLRVNNLFNKDLREPSPAPGALPNDFPLLGRQMVLQTNYRF